LNCQDADLAKKPDIFIMSGFLIVKIPPNKGTCN